MILTLYQIVFGKILSTSSSRTSLEEHRLGGMDEHHACEFGDILPRHLPTSPEVCHQALGGHLDPGVSALELCLPSTPPSRQVAVPAAIATTAATGAAATTSSSSRLCICCTVVETATTSPTTSRGKRGEHQSVPALSLSLAPTSTPNPQLLPTDPAILPSDCQQLSCQHPTGQPTGHQQRQGQQHHQEQDQEPEFHQGPFHVTDDLQHPASEAASEPVTTSTS